MTATHGDVNEHLHHMTDGRWHDSCRWCLYRSIWGGDGTALPLRAVRYYGGAKP